MMQLKARAFSKLSVISCYGLRHACLFSTISVFCLIGGATKNCAVKNFADEKQKTEIMKTYNEIQRKRKRKAELVLLGHTLTCLLIRLRFGIGRVATVRLLNVKMRLERSTILILDLNDQTVIRVRVAVMRIWLPKSQALPHV